MKVSSGKMLLCFGCRLDFTEPGVRLRLFPRGSEMRSCGESVCECTLVCLPHAISIPLPGPKASLATTPHIQQRAEHKKRWKTLQRLWCASAIFCKNLQNCLFCNLQCFRWGLRTGNLQQESRTLRATDTKWLQSLQSFTPDWETEGHPVCFPRFAWTSPCMSMWLLINEPKLLAFVWLVPLPNLSKARWQPLTPEAWNPWSTLKHSSWKGWNNLWNNLWKMIFTLIQVDSMIETHETSDVTQTGPTSWYKFHGRLSRIFAKPAARWTNTERLGQFRFEQPHLCCLWLDMYKNWIIDGYIMIWTIYIYFRSTSYTLSCSLWLLLAKCLRQRIWNRSQKILLFLPRPEKWCVLAELLWIQCTFLSAFLLSERDRDRDRGRGRDRHRDRD
jgi:hypothetical protein